MTYSCYGRDGCEMRLLVISDIHGNWPAVQAIVGDAAAVGKKGKGLAGDLRNALISMLRIGNPCAVVRPEIRAKTAG